jgi:predicted nucleic acid-binding protein
MNQVFIDAGPLRAFIVPRDQWRQQTMEIMTSLMDEKQNFTTTDYIINEVFTGLLGIKRTDNRRIQEFDQYMFKNSDIHLEWITRERFYQTKKLFLKVSQDKQWSFTDCASFVVMKELGIKTVFTFDEHFTQMGFKLPLCKQTGYLL